MFDINKLTCGEVAKIEDLSGQAITNIGDDGAPKGLMLAALALIAKRREDPSFSWNKAQELTFAEASALIGAGAASEDEEAPAPLEQAEPAPRKKKS